MFKKRQKNHLKRSNAEIQEEPNNDDQPSITVKRSGFGNKRQKLNCAHTAENNQLQNKFVSKEIESV